MNRLIQFLQFLNPRHLGLTLVLTAPIGMSAAETGRSFATPEEAVAALVAAVNAEDAADLRFVLGPAGEDLENPDRVQATNEMGAFAAALDRAHRIVRDSDSRCVLEVGEGRWPFPVPLVKREGNWFFDTEAGLDELLNRRIGQNELNTLRVVRAYVEAQREYAMKDRDGDEVLEFAQRIGSAPGEKDGLYWSPDLDGEISPLGPLIARAHDQGYASPPRETGAQPAPFHGYFFKVLTRQTKAAPGGKYDYLINGNMIGGFALVAWPAEYGQSGIMTFLVNQQGRVYQRDLGPETAKTVKRMNAYDPNPTWSVSPD